MIMKPNHKAQACAAPRYTANAGCYRPHWVPSLQTIEAHEAFNHGVFAINLRRFAKLKSQRRDSPGSGSSEIALPRQTSCVKVRGSLR